jgi:DNA-binding CsgD family transcriptional regulator
MLAAADQDHVVPTKHERPSKSSGVPLGIDNVRASLDQIGGMLGLPARDTERLHSVSDAETALLSALQIVTNRLHPTDATISERLQQLSDLDQVRQAQVLLHATVSSRRAEAMSQVRIAVDNLRRLGTVAELVSQAPAEAARLGFDRVLLSTISDARWIARSAYASGDTDLANAMVDAGNQTHRVIDARLVEFELVRQRKSLLVRDVLHNDRVHPELARLVKPEAYVVAPIIANGSVVGFIHADTQPDGDRVDEFDRDMLDTFSTGLSIALQSAYYREQLDRIRRHTDDLGRNGSSLLVDDASVDDGGQTQRSLPPSTRSLLRSAGGMLDRLTRREIEVLTHLANGETNRRIAARLFVSEATVKAHVKHILRKLGAANRAEAVSRYFRAG